MLQILYVDDNPGALDAACRFFRDKPHDLQVAYGPEQGLKAVKRQAYDLVIADLSMPGMDGITFLRHVQERHPAAHRVLVYKPGVDPWEPWPAFAEVAPYQTALPKPFTYAEWDLFLAQAAAHPGGTALAAQPLSDRLFLSCEPEELGRLRAFAAEGLNRSGLDPSRQEQMAVALEEIVAAIILHARQARCRDVINLSLHAGDGEVEAAILYCGKTECFLRLDPPDFAQLLVESEGDGALMVRSVVDRIACSRAGTRSEIRLVQRIAPVPSR